ncbi:hypothetical protein EAE96_002236 [Botrytis aclada]|nr:hypothetical protein EAE96_002236 [Botrytis aclada]
MCKSCSYLNVGAQWLKVFEPGIKTSRKNDLFPSRLPNLNSLPESVGDLEETYERLDPIGYQQYLALIDIPGKEHETPAKECDEKFVDRIGATHDQPIPLHNVFAEAKSQKTPSLASAKTAVNDTAPINPENNTGNKIHYDTMTLHRLGEKAEKSLLHLCGGGNDVFCSNDIMQRYTVEAIEARERSGLFDGPKIMGLEESLEMKRNMEFGRRKWWKKVRDFRGKEWWRGGKKEWWSEAEKLEWIVVLKIEDIDRSKRFMPSRWDDSFEERTSGSQEVQSSVGQGEKNGSQEGKCERVGNLNENKNTKEEETMGIEEAERRMRILVKRLYVEGDGDEKIEV